MSQFISGSGGGGVTTSATIQQSQFATATASASASLDLALSAVQRLIAAAQASGGSVLVNVFELQSIRAAVRAVLQATASIRIAQSQRASIRTGNTTLDALQNQLVNVYSSAINNLQASISLLDQLIATAQASGNFVRVNLATLQTLAANLTAAATALAQATAIQNQLLQVFQRAGF